MTLRRLPALICCAVFATPGVTSAAPYRTTNFVVTAPDPNLAKTFGDRAEHFRREKALEWLGQEMPPWPQPCPLKVTITDAGAGGATTFSFGGGRGVGSQEMEIHGPVRQLLDSVLPHEVTHTVFAHHFGRPVPRWADEGGSVLSENDRERQEHDTRNRELINAGRCIRLRVLFPMAEYPRDMIVLYAQGYSVVAYLVEKGGGGQEGRRKLLQFLALGQGNSQRPGGAHGTPETWNAAVREVYGVAGVDALEAEWIGDLHKPKSLRAARNTAATPTAGRGGEFAATGVGRAEVRSSAAPALPNLLGAPVKAARGSAPDYEPVSTTGATARPPAPPAARPAIPDRPPPVLLPPEIPRPASR